MDNESAVMIAGRILACYPAAPRDDATVAAYAEEILERFAGADAVAVLALALGYCREQQDRYCPSAFELVGEVGRRLARAKAQACAPGPRLRLAEPPLTPERIAANKAGLRAIVEGL